MVQMDSDSLEAGRSLAHPPPGEEVVISGTSGSFPDCDNVADFKEKLYNKVDLISGDGRRWTLDHPEIPQRTGKLNNISKFDAGFFGIHYKQAMAMDPMCRIVLEKSAEAVFDAGYNPRSFYGKKVGVFVGACFSETEKTWFYEKLQVNGFGVTGCARAMLANRVSYWLGVKGPSYTIDTACSSSLYAIEHGYRAIREGLCDAAIVAGTNLCLHPYVSLQFSRLGVLSKDGKCKCFDEKANGYCRSEAISAMLLQKKKDARRIYATIIHAKTNCDGYKEEGITFPSGPLQQSLLKEFYAECQVNPSELEWVEAHGTGTKVGDPEELKAIETIFCTNRKTPLKVGSTKSNTGHSEPASGILSVTKVLLAMETGLIAPNINFSSPRKDIEALVTGKIEVVTETTPWNGGLVGVNSFGFGGANCHLLLKWNEKSKINGGLPKDDLPRLICISGRTQEAIDYILSHLETNSVDGELVQLFHNIFKDEVPGHLCRGYTIISKRENMGRGIKDCPTLKQPFWYFFPGFEMEWKTDVTELMKIPMIAQLFTQCSTILKKEKFDLIPFLQGKVEEKNKTFRNILTNCIVQIVICDTIKSLGFEPDNIFGTSFGEIVCAYFDGSITLEQAVLSAYHVAKIISQLETQKGCTAVIGLPYSKLKTLCPSEVTIVYQGEKSTYVSGPETTVKNLVDKTKGSHSKILFHVALHGNQLLPIKTTLLQQLQKIIPGKRISSPKWISTSIKEKNNSFVVNAEYFCNNIVSPIHFRDLTKMVERNSAIFEISPCHIADIFTNESIVRKKLSFVHMLTGSSKDVLVQFLTSLGELGNYGANLDLTKLYPTVEFPVSRSTSMIAPLIRWDHEDDWYVTSYKTQDRITTGERFISISLKDDEQEYISGHVIDGRNLFPATGYLFLVWESIALMNAKLYGEVPVVFENVRFNRATNMPKDGGSVDFTVTIQRSSGFFEVLESGAAVVTGTVFVPENVSDECSGLRDEAHILPNDDIFVVKSKDIYKELRLRGYNYKALFKSVMCANLDGTKGFIKWHNNYVAFMDNMLQMQIMNSDSRALFVPTGLSRVVIDVKKHAEIIQQLDEDNKGIPVYNYKYVKLIRAGGIEIRGLSASAINRRKPLGEPVLEKYEFVPYNPINESLDCDTVIRMFTHIVLENNPTIVVKVFESGDIGSFEDYLCHSVVKALADLPLIQPDIAVHNPQLNKLGEDRAPEISIEEKVIPSDQTGLLVIGCNLLDPANDQTLQMCASSVKDSGYIISRDRMHHNVTSSTVIKCSSVICDNTYFTLLRKVKAVGKKVTAIEISNDSLSWIKPLQESIKSDEFKKVVLYSQNQTMSGILGLINCIIKEGYSDKVRCFFILDKKAPKFSLDDAFYMKQFDNDLAVNIYKDGTWGSYRHLCLDSNTGIETPHSYVTFVTKGDLSSLAWTEGHLSKALMKNPDYDAIHVYYSALNFRDVMTATGKLAPEVVERNRLYQDCVQGLEFAGRYRDGRRVMGMVGHKGIATVVDPRECLLWDVPENWSLEDAVTVPCVYGTILYAFNLVGNLQKGDSILIHAGTGGIGMASIHYALFHGCKVLTTVGTPEKREFIKKMFPQLKDNQIGNSRDTSFEQLVMRETNGRGVDFVMNSLAEEKLIASVRCLAKGGRFLELGKFDMANDNPLGVEFLKREASFHGIMLNVCFYMEDKWRSLLQVLVADALKTGAIKPFHRTVFPRNEVENALRYMAAGKHMGKVLIKIREEEPNLITIPKPIILKSRPRYYCDPNKSYVILGGLGGFGLELCDWLVLRKAKKIVLSSRQGVKQGYQAMRIKIWETYKVEIKICTDDISTEKGVSSLLQKANEMGPIGGIFNLAVLLKDAMFDNQTEENFVASFNPKATATALLDKISRKMCPELDLFVVFSSVSCGRGNAGQTNYGMSNSIMERICEQRVLDGYPGLAIQWGAVGDVGLVANMQEENSEIVIGGTLPQKIESCLSVLDMFLHEKYPVVASMVVAEKKAGSGGAGNMVDTVLNIIGLRDLKSISLHSSLAELGMDSMMAVEIKQTLEREYEVFLTPQDIRGMTFAKLQDIATSRSQPGSYNPEDKTADMLPAGFQLIVRTVGDESTAQIPIIKFGPDGSNTTISTDYSNRVFCIPGLEGFAQVFQNFSKHLKAECLCVQYDNEFKHDNIFAIAENVYQIMRGYIDKKFTVHVVGYSYGGIVALELIKILESRGFKATLCIIDGSPDLMKQLLINSIDTSSEDSFQIGVLSGFVDILWPQDKTKLMIEFNERKDWDSRLDIALNATVHNLMYSESYKKAVMTGIYKRLQAIGSYMGLPENTLKTPLTLIRPETNMLIENEEDYSLSKYFTSPATVHIVEGNHLTILDNQKAAEIINAIHASKN